MEASRSILIEALEDLPGNAWLQSRLARTYAYLGHRREAMGLGQQAAKAFSDDSYSGPRFLEDLAVIHMVLGDFDQAIDLLEDLLSLKYQNAVGIVEVQLDPLWDPLRDHPRFAKLLESQD